MELIEQAIPASPTRAKGHAPTIHADDLVAIFDHDLEPEVKKVVANWWLPQTQATLRALVDRLRKT